MRCKRRLPICMCCIGVSETLVISGTSRAIYFRGDQQEDVPHCACDRALKALLVMYQRLSRPLYDLLVTKVKEAATLAALRDTLLPKLISGEIRVQDAERTVESVP